MPNVCKVDKDVPCKGGSRPQTITFGQPSSSKALNIKKKALRSLLNKGKKCYQSGECNEPIVITAVTIGGCDVCKQHIPEVEAILQKIAKTEIGKRVPVQLIEQNYFKGGKKIFDQFRCEGTPCFIINGQRKMYEGRRGEVGVLASILKMKNPLYK